MKKIFFAAAIVATGCTASVPEHECHITVNLEEMPDTMLLYVPNAQMDGFDIKGDTLVAVDGKMTYVAHIEGARNAMLAIPGLMSSYNLVLLPGQRLEVTDGVGGNYRMGGSDIYDELNEASSLCDEYVEQLDVLQQEFTTRMRAGENSSELQKEMEAKYDVILAQIIEAKGEYISANPSSNGAVMLLCDMHNADFAKYDTVVANEVKDGALADLYAAAKARYDKELARQEAKAKLVPGAMAPDFTLPMLDGGELTLSSLRGKYVIIDFWGSWCGWCIKGMPDMKKYYDKYKGKLEIVGVDCRDSDEKWCEAVQQHKLNWKHVKNGDTQETDITVRYAVQGYPTKIIIAPDGTIVEYVVGESASFYKVLDDIFRK